MTREITIPGEFWKSLNERQFRRVCETSKLGPKLTRRLWRMLGRTDEPPADMMVRVNREDVMREFPPKESYN